MGVVRRLYFGSKTLIRFVLLVPIVVFMVYFSYNVDCSGLFQGALAPRRIVDLMLEGYDVTNYDQMDEREVVQLFAQDVPETASGPAVCFSSPASWWAATTFSTWASPVPTCGTA